jgi:hypothetical protein
MFGPLLASWSRSARHDPFLTACAARSGHSSQYAPEGTPNAGSPVYEALKRASVHEPGPSRLLISSSGA